VEGVIERMHRTLAFSRKTKKENRDRPVEESALLSAFKVLAAKFFSSRKTKKPIPSFRLFLTPLKA